MATRKWDTDFESRELQPMGVTPAVRWLLAVNVGVYFLQLVLFGSDNVAGWLGLAPEDFPGKWWTVGTYMFVHAGLMHLGLNMLMLWMFGPRMEREFGTRSFTYFYLWCGLGGAVFHLLFVQRGLVVGASGAVVGVVLSYALRWPDEDVYLFGVMPMRARWLAVWMIAWNVGMAIADMTGFSRSGTAWMAHVGGLVFAWLYINAPKSSSLEKIRRHVSTVPDETEVRPIPPRGQRARKRESMPAADEAVARSHSIHKKRPIPVDAVATQPRRRRSDDIDALLDKISKEGIGSLTAEERLLLEDVSRRLRG